MAHSQFSNLQLSSIPQEALPCTYDMYHMYVSHATRNHIHSGVLPAFKAIADADEI